MGDPVQGSSGAGTTFAVPPVVLGGIDSNGVVRTLLVDSTGAMLLSSPTDPVLKDLGLLSQNYSVTLAAQGNAGTPASGTIYESMIPTQAGITYTGVELLIATAGVGTAPTGFFVGLAQNAVVGATGLMLAQSSNLKASTSLTTVGLRQFPFSAPFLETVSGFRAVTILKNVAFSGTDVQFRRVAGQAIGGSGEQVLSATVGTGQTVLAANGAATAAVAVDGTYFWVGLY